MLIIHFPCALFFIFQGSQRNLQGQLVETPEFGIGAISKRHHGDPQRV